MAGSQFTRLGTHNMVLPKEGPKAYTFTLDFTTQNEQELDFIQEITEGFISFVQGVMVDNTLNTNPLFIRTAQIGFPLQIPAGKQAIMPLPVTDVARIKFTTVQDADLVVPVVVMNTPVSPLVW